MNLVSVAPQWAVISLSALLLLAALQDAVQLKISNLICLAVLLLGVGVLLKSGLKLDIWQNLLLLAAALTIGTMLFSAGKIGGGDVKLLAATLFWFNLASAAWLLPSVAIAGGILAFVIIGVRMFAWSESTQQRALLLRRKGGIPYGVAIAAGALLTISLTGTHRAVDPRTNFAGVPGQAR